MTGLLARRGSRSLPELQRAAQAWCSRLQTAAVSEGLVRVGVVIVDKSLGWYCDGYEVALSVGMNL